MKPAIAAAVLLGLSVTAAPAASASEPVLRLSCRNEPAPGRLLCELEMEASAGRLAWADALIVRTPDFARPLRSRVGPREARTSGARRLELPLAFVAARTGKGEIEVLARSVVCNGAAGSSGERCTPFSRNLRAKLEVGLTERDPR
jgi:hypothetical protein